MKKRHHSSHHGSGMGYRGEGQKAEMISENHSAIANLPQEVMIKPYPPMPGYMPEDLDDTIHGIDRQMEGDHRAAKGGLKPMKF